MELFYDNGHLTGEALRTLAHGGELTELERLEAGEHLAFCDQCLDRYTALLTGDVLLTPERTCRDALWPRIRRRAARLLASRWATAVAAMIIVVSLWSFGVFGGMVDVSSRLTEWEPPAASQEIREQRGQLSRRVTDFFDGLGQGISGIFANRTPPAAPAEQT